MDDTTQLIPDGTVKPDMAPGSPCSEIDKAQGDLAASANYFVVDPVFLATNSMQLYQRAHQDPLHRPLRISRPNGKSPGWRSGYVKSPVRAIELRPREQHPGSGRLGRDDRAVQQAGGPG